MNMEKLIKGYFYFLLILMSIVSLGNNENVGDYYANVFDSIENFGNEIIEIKNISIVSSLELNSFIPVNILYTG